MDDLDQIIRKHIEEEVAAEKVPEAALRKAKDLMKGGMVCPHCGKPITPFKKPLTRQMLWNGLWLGLAVTMFLASFLFRPYFFQFLVLTLLFGFKWILERRSMKTQILIYKALQEEGGGSRLKDLHQHASRL